MDDIKEINKTIKATIKDYKKLLKSNDIKEEEKASIENGLKAFTLLLEHNNDDEKALVFDAMGRVQLLKEELMYLNMFFNLFLNNAITVEQYAKQVSTKTEEEYKEYVERYRKAYADLESKGVFGKSE